MANIIPASFRKAGFAPIEEVRKQRRVMITTEGPRDSGKTEFALSAPGPGMVLCLDRGFDAVFDNKRPPPTRRNDFFFKVVQAPVPTQAKIDIYLDYWRSFKQSFYDMLDNPDVRTCVLDGDSDSWELQRLAEFGKLTQIPSIMYTGVNAARRALYARAFDSNKIIIATNKVSKDYKTVMDPATGEPLKKDGKEVREWDGKSYKRQGFEDNGYLFSIRLRHLVRDTYNGPEWGIQIRDCKADMALKGLELWGELCNMPALLQTIYPTVPLKEWGY